MPDDFFEAVRRNYGVPLDEFETRLRQEWGGERVYIQKATVSVKGRNLAAAIANGLSPREAFAACDIPERTGWRIIGRRYRRR